MSIISYSEANQFEPPLWFKGIRKKAQVISRDFIPKKCGEVDPKLTTAFLSQFMISGQILWEPFAGQGKTIELAQPLGITVLASDLIEVPGKVSIKDAKIDGPMSKSIDAALFHPPYFGSAPFSSDPRDLARITDKLEYCKAVKLSIAFAAQSKAKFICVVGRRYSVAGKVINLDWWYTNMCLEYGYTIAALLSSVPDMAVVLEKRLTP